MTTSRPESLETTIIWDLASRLRYLGFHGDVLKEMVTDALTETSLETYSDIREASYAAGYHINIDLVDWSRHRLPDPSQLPSLSGAIRRIYGDVRVDNSPDPADPRLCFKRH